MLRTNLATRPFYNVRAVQVLLGVAAAIVLGVTLFNLIQLVRLTSEQRRLGASAAQAEQNAARLRGEAARLRAQIDPKQLQVVANAAREANSIIDRRVFSWTDLFSEFEATLPADVRITAVQPRLENDGSFVVAVRVEARRVEDLDAFLNALESSGAFRNVLPRQEQTTEDGLIEAIVDGVYTPRARGDRAAPVGDASGSAEVTGASNRE